MSRLDKLKNFPDEFIGTETGWRLQQIQLDLAAGINRVSGKVLTVDDVWNRVMDALHERTFPGKTLD